MLNLYDFSQSPNIINQYSKYITKHSFLAYYELSEGLTSYISCDYYNNQKNNIDYLLNPTEIRSKIGELSKAIEAKNSENELFLILSTTAYNALNEGQIKALLESYKDIIHSDIPTIEKYGGGSARCMLTELF